MNGSSRLKIITRLFNFKGLCFHFFFWCCFVFKEENKFAVASGDKH